MRKGDLVAPLRRIALAVVGSLLAACSAAPLQTDNSVTLKWQSPAADEALSGYRIFFWNASGPGIQSIDVPDANANEFRIRGLPPGDYYFSIVAYDENATKSELSNVIRKTVL